MHTCFLKHTRKLGSMVSPTHHRTPSVIALFPHLFPLNGSTEEFIPGAGTPVSLQGYQPNMGKDHVFEIMRTRDIERYFDSNVDTVSFSSQKCQNSVDLINDVKTRESACYQPASNVSLHCVMQTNVPEPYSNQGRPSHLNMPGGNAMLDQKYTSSKLNSNHPSRNMGTYIPLGSLRDNTHTINLSGVHSIFPTRNFSSSAQLLNVKTKAVEPSGAIPECISQDEYAAYQKWMERNEKYCFDYSEQYTSLVNGDKSLDDVIFEQEALIAAIARQYEVQVSEGRYNYEGIQGDLGPQPWLKNHTVASLKAEDLPHPEGVQGLNCEHFQVWLDNCSKYHYMNCNDQLRDVEQGRKTLGQIFEEQERIIKEVASEYKARQSSKYQTQGGLEGAQSRAEQTTSAPDAAGASLSQGERLKRAVKDYGSTVIVFHVAISLASLGGFYLAVSSGLDVVGLLGKLGVGQSILESRLATGASTFVVAYAVHKVFAPVRIATTLTCTPLIVRYLRRVGVLKAPKIKAP